MDQFQVLEYEHQVYTQQWRPKQIICDLLIRLFYQKHLIDYLEPKLNSQTSTTFPPAASIAARAPLVSNKPWIVNFLFTSPDK